jgi:hypothetical protein
MGYMKELDIRIRNGGDDAISAVQEYLGVRGKVLDDITKTFSLIPVWVSVSERLPEEGQEVLWYSSHDRFARCRWATGKREGDLVDWGGDLSAKIDGWLTHWMPLPEPPA